MGSAGGPLPVETVNPAGLKRVGDDPLVYLPLLFLLACKAFPLLRPLRLIGGPGLTLPLPGVLQARLEVGKVLPVGLALPKVKPVEETALRLALLDGINLLFQPPSRLAAPPGSGRCMWTRRPPRSPLKRMRLPSKRMPRNSLKPKDRNQFRPRNLGNPAFSPRFIRPKKPA
jgi:hypothetical protein